jgi:hypothetical protein
VALTAGRRPPSQGPADLAATQSPPPAGSVRKTDQAAPAPPAVPNPDAIRPFAVATGSTTRGATPHRPAPLPPAPARRGQRGRDERRGANEADKCGQCGRRYAGDAGGGPVRVRVLCLWGRDAHTEGSRWAVRTMRALSKGGGGRLSACDLWFGPLWGGPPVTCWRLLPGGRLGLASAREPGHLDRRLIRCRVSGGQTGGGLAALTVW